MKWPKRITHRKKVLATIYRKTKNYPFYRVAYSIDGSRRMKSFANYGGQDGAKAWADQKAKELAKGSRVPALTPKQANDALASLERLQIFYESTGRRVSLYDAVRDFCESARKLPNGKSVPDAVEAYLGTVATVKRLDLKSAIDEFIKLRKAKTIEKDGKRPKLSPEHHYNTSIWLQEFADTFPGYAVCDLTKQLLDKYMGNHADVGAKTRNERRGVVKMFLRWSVDQDYLSPTHRLFESPGMKTEATDAGDIETYTAQEFKRMLDRGGKIPANRPGEDPEPDFRPLLPVLALAGLAGLRWKEILRLTWEDVFHKSEHIEVSGQKSKTRARRLIQISPALAQWLSNYKDRTGKVWDKSYDMLHTDFAALRAELKIESRRNGLRHAFVSAHFAVHSDEGLTAAQSGNSPTVIHKHYKGLMTKKEGEAWFNVAPDQPANVVQLKSA